MIIRKKLLIPIIGIPLFFFILFLVNAELERLDELRTKEINEIHRSRGASGNHIGKFQVINDTSNKEKTCLIFDCAESTNIFQNIKP